MNNPRVLVVLMERFHAVDAANLNQMTDSFPQ